MPRGGGLKNVRVSFKSVKNKTLGDVFGTKPISPPEMMKTIWAFIKKKGLMKKKKKVEEDDD